MVRRVDEQAGVPNNCAARRTLGSVRLPWYFFVAKPAALT